MRNLKMKQIKEEAEQVSEAVINGIKNAYASFLKFVNPKGFLKKVVFLTTIFIFISVTNTMPEGSTSIILPSKSPEVLYVESVKEKMKSQLISEVDRYIKSQAPNSQLTPEHLVEKCLDYNTDVVFVLAQALLESHFGTKGTAERTNSVWNVGAFDNQKPRNWYDHPDESLEPYLKLIKEDYLINITSRGDTIHKNLHDLVVKSYTNYAGKRFASARGYENALRKLIVTIDMETSISFYQKLINMPDEQILTYFNPTSAKNVSRDLYALNEN